MAAVVANLLCNGVTPSAVATSTLTTIQYFPSIPGFSIGAVATSPVAGFIPIPGSNRANGQRLSVRATGNVSLGADSASPTVTLGLYYTTKTIQSAALANISKIFSVTVAAAGLGIVPFPWAFTVDMNCDNASGILSGSYSLVTDNEAASTGALQSISGIVMSADQPFAICVGITFSSASAGNSANMYQFDLSA